MVSSRLAPIDAGSPNYPIFFSLSMAWAEKANLLFHLNPRANKHKYAHDNANFATDK
jgi:hypothetical protein